MEGMIGPAYQVAREPDVEAMARALHGLVVTRGGQTTSFAWAGLDDNAKGYWLMEARTLLCVAFGEPVPAEVEEES